MIALITLVIPVGGSAGPFDLYSNTDGYTVPFATNVSAAILQAGYTSNVVPNGTVTIRVISSGVCTNSIDIPLNVLPTTSTTSTTTTVAQACYVYDLTATINNASWSAQLCYGRGRAGVLPFIGDTFTTPCIINTSLVLNGITAVQTSFDCSTTTTTSSSTSTSTTSTSSSTTTTTTTAEPTTTTTTTTVYCVAGDLVLANETNASFIDDVYATGWFIATATPVPPITTYSGAQGGTNDPISVDLTIIGPVSCVSLYVNCVKIESIEAPVTGTYTFSPVNILNADAVTITLTETGSC